ncbi:hypothetical protein BDR07DRAFT_1485939 [Suillus spraguei]|nr:hypothetical protein BDR07DRAFT_1485939 [Suillus spraguei]
MPYAVKMLLQKYKCANKGINDTKVPFEELTSSLEFNQVSSWEKDEKQAIEQCGEYLDIYHLNIDKAPTMAEIQLKLTETEYAVTGKSGLISWLINDINLDALRADIRQLPRDASAAQKAVTADAMTDCIEVETGMEHIDDVRFCARDMEEQGQQAADLEDSLEETGEEVVAEGMRIWMPSSVPHQDALPLGLGTLQAEELELWQGQANDCLEKLRRLWVTKP